MLQNKKKMLLTIFSNIDIYIYSAIKRISINYSGTTHVKNEKLYCLKTG